MFPSAGGTTPELLPGSALAWRSPWSAVLRNLQQDPRFYQILVLGFLVCYSWWALDFAMPLGQALPVIGMTLVTQFVGSVLWHTPAYDPRSALISGLSLCLLLRTNSLPLALLTAVITIASKFLVCWRGKHLFNPTNFGLVVMMGCTKQVWVSPGQWGNPALLALLFLGLGTLVVYRAARSDITYAFLGLYSLLLVSRALWLGDALTIPFHQLRNGAFLLFAFLMISDPKTTPDSRTGRLVFALIVTLAAGYGQFVRFQSTALLWALAASTVTVPVLNWLWPGPRYRWPVSSS